MYPSSNLQKWTRKNVIPDVANFSDCETEYNFYHCSFRTDVANFRIAKLNATSESNLSRKRLLVNVALVDLRQALLPVSSIVHLPSQLGIHVLVRNRGVGRVRGDQIPVSIAFNIKQRAKYGGTAEIAT